MYEATSGPSAGHSTSPFGRSQQGKGEAGTQPAGFRRVLLVFDRGEFRAQPGRVLEDALRAGVVDELRAADQTFLHRHLAPGAEPVRESGGGGCCRICHSGAHCHREL